MVILQRSFILTGPQNIDLKTESFGDLLQVENLKELLLKVMLKTGISTEL
jgi:hypothetical protein